MRQLRISGLLLSQPVEYALYFDQKDKISPFWRVTIETKRPNRQEIPCADAPQDPAVNILFPLWPRLGYDAQQRDI